MDQQLRNWESLPRTNVWKVFGIGQWNMNSLGCIKPEVGLAAVFFCPPKKCWSAVMVFSLPYFCPPFGLVLVESEAPVAGFLTMLILHGGWRFTSFIISTFSFSPKVLLSTAHSSLGLLKLPTVCDMYPNLVSFMDFMVIVLVTDSGYWAGGNGRDSVVKLLTGEVNSILGTVFEIAVGSSFRGGNLDTKVGSLLAAPEFFLDLAEKATPVEESIRPFENRWVSQFLFLLVDAFARTALAGDTNERGRITMGGDDKSTEASCPTSRELFSCALSSIEAL